MSQPLNTFTVVGSSCSNGPLTTMDRKKAAGGGVVQDSLLSMAMSLMHRDPNPLLPSQSLLAPPVTAAGAPTFHPLGEYADLSLKGILDLADDFAFDDDEDEDEAAVASLMPNPVLPPTPDTSSSSAAPVLQVDSTVPSGLLTFPPPLGGSQDLLMPNPVFADTPLTTPTTVPDLTFALTPSRPIGCTSAAVPSVSLVSPTATEPASPEPDNAVSSDAANASAFVRQESLSGSKRRRESADEIEEPKVETTTTSNEEEDESPEARFRPCQTKLWAEKYTELCDYFKQHGNVNVPNAYSNQPLARWVKRQRYQYKLLMDGKESTMTLERVKVLEEVGFVWDSQKAAWYERLGELMEFRKKFSHCNVPTNFRANPQLATWVKCQRRQMKLMKEGKQSNMTTERMAELDAINFEWSLREYKKSRTN